MSLVVMNIRKLTLMAILTAIALIIFIIEALIPLPVPIPGVKLGLANAVTLFALFYGAAGAARNDGAKRDDGAARNDGEGQGVITLTAANAFAILLCRIVLGAVFVGRPVALFYSLTGGLLGFAAQVIMKRFVSEKQIWVCGAVGAVFHNIGQILAAIVITGTPAIVLYLPMLIIAGVITGALTGFIAQFTLTRIRLPLKT